MTNITNPVYRHPKRPDWGLGIVAQDLPDLVCAIFESGRTAKFFKNALPIELVELPDAERATLYARLKRSQSPAASGGKRAPSRKPKVALYEPTSFEQQVSIFQGMFAQGFADPDFVAQERTSERADPKGAEVASTLAKDVLGKEKLSAAIAEGRFADVIAAAVSVAKATNTMAHPQFELAPLATTPAESQEKVARALFALLHGEGDYAPRFDAFVASLGSPFWTIATIFPALLTPSEHFFAKPKVEQRQAKLLAMDEPPGGVPSHEGYLRYRAIGVALKERLVAAGLAPRDLLDVYSFVTTTLSAKPIKTPKAPKAPKAAKPEPAPEADATS